MIDVARVVIFMSYMRHLKSLKLNSNKVSSAHDGKYTFHDVLLSLLSSGYYPEAEKRRAEDLANVPNHVARRVKLTG